MSDLLVFIAEMELQRLEYDGEVKTSVIQTFTFEMYFSSSSTLTNYMSSSDISTPYIM